MKAGTLLTDQLRTSRPPRAFVAEVSKGVLTAVTTHIVLRFPWPIAAPASIFPRALRLGVLGNPGIEWALLWSARHLALTMIADVNFTEPVL